MLKSPQDIFFESKLSKAHACIHNTISQKPLKKGLQPLTHPPVFENMRHALPLTISAFNWHLRIQLAFTEQLLCAKHRRRTLGSLIAHIRESLRLFECLDWKMMYLSVGGWGRLREKRGCALSIHHVLLCDLAELHAACRCLTNMHWTHKWVKKKKKIQKNTEIGLEIMKHWNWPGNHEMLKHLAVEMKPMLANIYCPFPLFLAPSTLNHTMNHFV